MTLCWLVFFAVAQPFSVNVNHEDIQGMMYSGRIIGRNEPGWLWWNKLQTDLGIFWRVMKRPSMHARKSQRAHHESETYLNRVSIVHFIPRGRVIHSKDYTAQRVPSVIYRHWLISDCSNFNVNVPCITSNVGHSRVSPKSHQHQWDFASASCQPIRINQQKGEYSGSATGAMMKLFMAEICFCAGIFHVSLKRLQMTVDS